MIKLKVFTAILTSLITISSASAFTVIVHNNDNQNKVGAFINEWGKVAAVSPGNILKKSAYTFTDKDFTQEGAYWGAQLKLQLYPGATCDRITYIPESTETYEIWVSKTQCHIIGPF